jgi:hypothetical protein
MRTKLRRGDVLLRQYKVFHDYIDIIELSIIIREEEAIYELEVDEKYYDNKVIMDQMHKLFKEEMSVKEMDELPMALYNVLIENNVPRGFVIVLRTHG